MAKKKRTGPGGPRPGSGRPKVSPELKRIGIGVTLQREIVDFLASRDINRSRWIEQKIRASAEFREWKKGEN